MDKTVNKEELKSTDRDWVGERSERSQQWVSGFGEVTDRILYRLHNVLRHIRLVV